MSDSPSRVELRRSVSLLTTEWWLLVGAVVGYLLYGVWVVATGIALGSAGPTLATPVTTVGSTTVTVSALAAGVLWLVVPALVATRLLGRQLSNTSGNLVTQYRLDNPGVLPAPSGALALLFAVAAVVVGPAAPVVALGAVASIHLLVRTVALGRRSYSFSPRLLFPTLSALSGVALAAAWLVHAPGLPAPASQQVARAGVGAVVDTGTAIAGTTPATALGVLVAVPALLSGSYLAVQALVASRVRSRAPLANPEPGKRAEQRYPVMPPVPDAKRPGPTRSTASTGSSDATDDEPAGPDDESGDGPADEELVDGVEETTADASDEDATDETSQTRVFSSSEPMPEDGEMTTKIAAKDEADEDDGWIDDTSIFSADRDDGDDDECTSCGKALPDDASVTFCPNCGQKI